MQSQNATSLPHPVGHAHLATERPQEQDASRQAIDAGLNHPDLDLPTRLFLIKCAGKTAIHGEHPDKLDHLATLATDCLNEDLSTAFHAIPIRMRHSANLIRYRGE